MHIPDYSQITEYPGLQATNEQISRIYHRYHFALEYIRNKEVLEVACGSGIGLGYLAKTAKTVTGIDINDKNLKIASNNYKNHTNIILKKGDAHELPFPSNSFDVVLLFEAIYYLQNPQKFIEENVRVLNDNGIIIICTVNKNWKDFHPSPFTYNYYSIPELYALLNTNFKNVKIFGAFKMETGFISQIISFIKRLVVKLNLIPGNLNSRTLLKRIFIGKTSPIPQEIHDGMTYLENQIELPNNMQNYFLKIIYATGIKKI